MKKIMKVELNQSRQQTEEHGRLYKSQNWDIPFDSTEVEPKTSALELHMLEEVKEAFPKEVHETISKLIYSSLSPLGTLQIGEFTLKVSFAIDHGQPSR